MIGWPESAYIGQRIICVGANEGPGFWFPGEALIDGEVYTIAGIFICSADGRLTFDLVEKGSRLAANKAYGIRCGYGAFRFRPVQTRDTSAQVEALKRLTLGVRDEVRA